MSMKKVISMGSREALEVMQTQYSVMLPKHCLAENLKALWISKLFGIQTFGK